VDEASVWIGEQASMWVIERLCVKVWVSGCPCLQMCRYVCVCIVLISQPYLYGLVLTLSCWAYSIATFKNYSLTDNGYGPHFLPAHSAYLSPNYCSHPGTVRMLI